MELSRYDLSMTKGERVNKTVPMSKELSEKINLALKYMPNTDFSKCTREMWVRLILSMRDRGVMTEPPETILVRKTVEDYSHEHFDEFLPKREPAGKNVFGENLTNHKR